VKALASFLAILVLFLSVQPVCSAPASAGTALVDACCSSVACEDEGSEPGDTEDDDCHNCNPFESTACCAVGMIVPQQTFALRTLLQPYPARVWNIAPPQFPAAVYGDFWQPPKLS